MNTPDELVMLAVKDGDTGQLAILFERHHKQLFDYFVRMTGNRSASEDLVQEVFVRMLKYRTTFNSGRHFVGWMFKIARNSRFHYLKMKQDLEINSAIDPTSVAAVTVDPDRSLQLHQALFRLPEDKRELLILARFHGFSSEEISEILDIEPGAVKVRLHRILNELRELASISANERTPCTAKNSKSILRTT